MCSLPSQGRRQSFKEQGVKSIEDLELSLGDTKTQWENKKQLTGPKENKAETEEPQLRQGSFWKDEPLS